MEGAALAIRKVGGAHGPPVSLMLIEEELMFITQRGKISKKLERDNETQKLFLVFI